jgi:hypothetical protein
MEAPPEGCPQEIEDICLTIS